MNLKEYFNQQKDNSISRYDMLNIYEKVLTKNHKKSLARRSYFLHAKSFVYSLVILFFFVGIYGVYFFNGNISLNDSGLIVQKLDNGTLVSADYVAKVVDFNGNFYIQHGDQYYQSSNIADGDTVILQNGTEMNFDINEGLKAKIIGPAKFVVKKSSESNYSLVLSYGDFIQMKSSAKTTDNMELYVDNLKIQPSQGMDFQIQKKDDRYDIKNQGSEIIVLHDNNKEIALHEEQALSIQNNNIVLFENIKDFGQALTYSNVSQTFSLDDESLLATTVDSENTPLLTMVSEQTNTQEIIEKENDGLLASQLGIASDKEILPLDDASKIESTLSKGSLTSLSQKMYVAYLIGDAKAFDSAFSSLTAKVKEGYGTFKLSFAQPTGTPDQKLVSLASSINTLYNHVATNYHISDTYLYNLKTIKGWCDHLLKTTYGSDTAATKDSIISSLPGNLYFK